MSLLLFFSPGGVADWLTDRLMGWRAAEDVVKAVDEAWAAVEPYASKYYH